MKKSFIFRRTVLLVIISVMLTALLTGISFYFVSHQLLIQRTTNNLIPGARSLSSWLSSFSEILTKSNEPLPYLIPTDDSLMRGKPYAFLNDGRQIELESNTSYTVKRERKNSFPYGRSLIYSIPKNPQTQKASKLSAALRNTYLETVTSGNEIMLVSGDYIIAGVPITDVLGERIIGAVFMCQPIQEITEIQNSLYSVLIISMSIISLIMMAIAFIATGQIVKPVNAMRRVALAMAGGNFDVRADQFRPGEIGELGASLNYLSSRLSQTISELQRERNRLRHILDGLSEGILAIDSDRNITHCNPSIEQCFGPFDPLFSTHEYIQDDGLWADFDSVISESCTVARLMHIDSKILRVTITPLEGSQGTIEGAVGLFRDVTESERLEQTRRDYVANVSHELRTPVSSIRSLSETLVDGMVKSEEDRMRYYGYMLHESERLSLLIDDLLELSRLQSGGVALKKRTVDINELLLDVIENYRLLAEKNNIKLELNCPENCPEAFTNAGRTEQVLVILLDNAFKYTLEGGAVSISAAWNEKSLQLSVADTGVGIEESDLPYIFDRFYKVDKAHSGNGTGLGLSIAMEILYLMGEEIWVTSKPGEGTTFTFTLHRTDDPYIEQDNETAD